MGIVCSMLSSKKWNLTHWKMKFLHIRQIKVAGNCFLYGRKAEDVDWIRTHIRNIYGWSDRHSASEPGPFSVKTYL